MVHSICDSYPKFGAAAPRQTGVIARRKKWGRLTPPPPSKCRVKASVEKLAEHSQQLAERVEKLEAGHEVLGLHSLRNWFGLNL